jgi:acetate---CoA ligase (ADP-forming)
VGRACLSEIFEAKSVAVVGASNDPRKAGHQVLKTLLREGYAGEIYAVNPGESSVLGIDCFPSILEIPELVELLIISVPAATVLHIMEEAEKRSDVKGAVILSAGFAETGIQEFIEAEKRVAEIARRSGIRVFGPNCIGIINPLRKLCTGFAPGVRLISGNIGYITQSGAFGGAFLMLAADQPRPLGFAKFGHVGNMCDVSNLELLEFYGNDPGIRVIVVYLEGVRDGREFINIASRISPKKPILVLKAGRTEGGSQAILSHTGTLAGSDSIYDGAFKQCGVIRLNTMAELLDSAKAISFLPKPRGENFCILTEAGGPGIICMDEIVSAGVLKPANLSQRTKHKLKNLLPSMAMICQPAGYVDMTAAALIKEHAESLRLILADRDVNSVIVISIPPTYLPAMDVAKALVPVIKKYEKPVLVCFMRGKPMAEARAHLEENGIPTFDSPEGAAKALNALTKGWFVTNHGIQELLSENGIPVMPYVLASKKIDAQSFAETLKTPVVLKIVSPHIIHKSDVGGVRLDLIGREAIGKAYERLMHDVRRAQPDADIRGILVLPLAEAGPEIIIGMIRDAQFGPVIMFGCGGIFVEVFHDVSFRVAPFSLEVALDMIRETRAFDILQGVRGQGPKDISGLADLLAKISQIAACYPEIVAIDINPVRIYEKGFAILDARILLAKKESKGD